MQERGTAFGARRCCDIAVVVRGAVEEVVGREGETRLVLQELVADVGIKKKAVGVHGIRHIASVEEEVGVQLERPRLQFVSGSETRSVVVDVLSWL